MTDDPLPEPTTQAEREAWWQLFDSVATELGLTHVYTPRLDSDWLPCCLTHWPHHDDCPTQDSGPHRE